MSGALRHEPGDRVRQVADKQQALQPDDSLILLETQGLAAPQSNLANRDHLSCREVRYRQPLLQDDGAGHLGGQYQRLAVDVGRAVDAIPDEDDRSGRRRVHGCLDRGVIDTGPRNVVDDQHGLGQGERGGPETERESECEALHQSPPLVWERGARERSRV